MWPFTLTPVAKITAEAMIPKNNFMSNLVQDVFIDHISPMLDVEDLVKLRRVSIWFYLLCNEPIIWKRIEKHIPLLPIPIRPSFKVGDTSTDHEYHDRVVRAISMDDNWYKEKPQVISTMTIDATLEVLDMALVPGGKFLVASVRDNWRFFVALYHLDHPKGPHVIARFPTLTKAYKLHARYMNFKADYQDEPEPVIMIAFVCRYFEPDGDVPQDIDVSRYGNDADIEPLAPVVHDLFCVHVALKPLELVTGAHRDPNDIETTKHKWWSSTDQYRPFTLTLAHSFTGHDMGVQSSPIESVSLFMQEGRPMVAAVRGHGPRGNVYDSIFLADLNTGAKHLVICQENPVMETPPETEYRNLRIRAACFLPEQKQIITMRTVYFLVPRLGTIGEHHYLERWDIPEIENSFNVGIVRDTWICPIKCLSMKKIHLSDPNLTKPFNSHPDLQKIKHHVPAISLYIETEEGDFHHWTIDPSFKEKVRTWPTASYDFRYVTPQTVHKPGGVRTHILPGAHRALLYTARNDDRRDAPAILSLRRYASPQFQFRHYPHERNERVSIYQSKKQRTIPRAIFATLPLRPETISPYQVHGLSSIAWDETVGRVCMVHGGGQVIEIFDFSHALPLDNRFLEWKARQPRYRNIEIDEEENEFVQARRERPEWYPEVERHYYGEEDMDICSDWEDYDE